MNIHIELQTQNKLILQNNSIFTFGLALDTFNFDAVFGYIKMPKRKENLQKHLVLVQC